MKHKIVLISPTAEFEVKNPKAIRLPELALSVLATYTPDDFEVKIIEEEVTKVDYNEDCDLVGISCMTSNAPRAYEIGKEFKKRGKTVVFGGIHPTVLPDEALQYGDSVVIGEAEGVWQTLLEDFKAGTLKSKYRSFQPDITCSLPIKRDLNKCIGIFNVKPVVTTKGCPYNCDFCCVTQFFGNKLRHIPVKTVVEDIQNAGGKNFLFLDDNIIGHPKYARELFQALIPLNIRWVGQASISFANNEEMMKLAKKSGCVGLFIGLESVTESQLRQMKKSPDSILKVEEAIKKVRDNGMCFHPSMVFGFDNDTKAVFDETLEFLMRNRIGSLSLHILTPYPGTRIYDQFKRENRLLTENWKYYDHGTVVFQPKHMSPMELYEGYIKVKTEFLKFSSIGKRFIGNFNHPLIYLAVNLAFKAKTKWEANNMKIRMEDILCEKPALSLQP